MKSFSDWVFEAKQGKKVPSPATIVSAPIRGQNQDQSGENDKNNTASYTISDSKVPDNWEENTPGQRMKTVKDLMKLGQVHGAVQMPHSKIKEETVTEVSSELVGKVNKARTVGGKPSKTEVGAKTLATAVKKAWVKSKVGVVKEEEIDEVIAGVGATRITPVNMGDNTPRVGSKNAPKKVDSSLQNAANQRVTQLDKAAQKEKDTAEKTREQETAKRQKEAEQRQKQAAKPPTPVKEEAIDEARGRPPKNASSEDPGSDNIINQLRQVITLRGQKPVSFVNGQKVNLNPGTAHRLLTTYDNLRTTAEKHAFSIRIHKSPESLRDVVAGKKEPEKAKISLAGKITGTQK